MDCPMPFRQKITLDGETYLITMRMAEILDELSRHMEEGEFEHVAMPDLHLSTARSLGALGFITYQARWSHTYARLTTDGVRAVALIRARLLSTSAEGKARREASREKRAAEKQQSRSRI